MNGRKTTLSLLLAAVASLLITAAAFAGSLTFAFTGTSSTSQATWDGGQSQISASTDKVGLGSPTGPSPLMNATFSFTSGSGAGGSGTVGSPYMFGASGADTITITGCLPGQGSGCSPVTLFTGQFLAGEEASWSDGKVDFQGVEVSGTINPLLASDLGYQTNNFIGKLNAILECDPSTNTANPCVPGTIRMLTAGDLSLTPGGSGDPPPTPEPSALLLLGSGMCGVTFFIRRRDRQRK